MRILGISAFYHDSAVCLIEDGKLLFAAQEERFSRKKHDSGFPEKALKRCLEYCGIQAADPRRRRILRKEFHQARSTVLHVYAVRPRRHPQLPVGGSGLGQAKDFHQGDHQGKTGPRRPAHLLHHPPRSAYRLGFFIPSPFQDAAVITIDGVGEWDTLTIARAAGSDFQILKRITFPHSLGLLYSAFTYFTGFKVNSGEYKLMGLAPYGEPVYRDLILRELIDLKEDGSFRLNLKYFNFHTGLTMTGKKFAKLFGVRRRKPETELRQVDMDIAASIQQVLEEIMEKIVRYAKAHIASDNLCLAGGVALNCVANGKILKKQIFKNIWIQPAAGDAGGALGAALYFWHKHLKNERRAGGGVSAQGGSFLGPHYSAAEIKAFLEEKQIKYREFDRAELIARWRN